MKLKFEKEISIKCVFTWCTCIFILVVSWKFEQISFLGVELWFQRSGALVTIGAALAEFYLIKRLARHHKWVQSCSMISMQSPHRLEAEKQITDTYIVPVSKIIESSNIILIISGTLVWGYGDIIFNVFN